MVFSKYIVRHTAAGGQFANAFIIPNHYNHSLGSFHELFKEARKTFSDLKEEDTECRTVQNSGWCKGCPVLQFPVDPNMDPQENWYEVEGSLKTMDVGIFYGGGIGWSQ